MKRNRSNLQSPGETITQQAEENHGGANCTSYVTSTAQLPPFVRVASHHETDQEYDADSQKSTEELAGSVNSALFHHRQVTVRSSSQTNTNNKMSVQNLISQDSPTKHFPFISSPLGSKEQEESVRHSRRSLPYERTQTLFPTDSERGIGMQYPFRSGLLSTSGRDKRMRPGLHSQAVGSKFDNVNEEGLTRFTETDSSVYMDGNTCAERRSIQLHERQSSLSSIVEPPGISKNKTRTLRRSAECQPRNLGVNPYRPTKSQCQTLALEPKTKKPWTEHEDSLLRSLVEQLGQGLWAAIAAQIPGRTGKQVRERWLNHLSPHVTKHPWSAEEDAIIIESHRRFGNCWSRIAKMLHGRSDNSVKNRFYTTLRRRIANPNNPGIREDHISNKRRTSPTPQKPSEQVEIVNRRYKQA